MWILSFDHVFTSHNIFVNSKRTYTSTRDSQGTPTDYIFQIEGLTQMHDYDDDLLYKNVILLTTCIFYWHMMKVGLEAPLYRGAGRKNLRGGWSIVRKRTFSLRDFLPLRDWRGQVEFRIWLVWRKVIIWKKLCFRTGRTNPKGIGFPPPRGGISRGGGILSL